jgi:TRAP-type C4-dicarboxylate transport system permease small subunit
VSGSTTSQTSPCIALAFSPKQDEAAMEEKRSLLSKVGKVNRSFITLLEWIGTIGLLTMMVITCVDVMGAKFFLRPVFGSIDIVVLAQVIAVSFGAASALVLGRHIQVEFFVILLPEKIQAAVEMIVNLLGLLLFVLIVWRLTVYGHYMQTGGEVSATARIPLYPFAYGIAFACIPVCVVFLLELVNSMIRMTNR